MLGYLPAFRIGYEEKTGLNSTGPGGPPGRSCPLLVMGVQAVEPGLLLRAGASLASVHNLLQPQDRTQRSQPRRPEHGVEDTPPREPHLPRYRFDSLSRGTLHIPAELSLKHTH